jgi:uncharacterized protein (DUF362 family)/Pyruvate/2-oxoacid:ferredoxin oxidoreductase delta subunit
LDLLGGVSRFVEPGEKILLKPNLLVPELPQKCVTTHPAVFQAVAELVIEVGVRVTFGDSPAVGSMARAAGKAGLTAVAERLGVEPADFKNGRKVTVAGALQNKQFVIANGALDCDGIVSLPKLKTHALERLTGCVKNQFSCVPGLLKGEFHVKLPDAHQFGRMLVDLNHYLKPRLYVMDGIQAMEGNGPRGGKPKQMNVILISSDPIALDATVCRLIDIDPEIVPTIRYGVEAGLGTCSQEDIALLGDCFDALKCTVFEIDRKPIRAFNPKRGWVMRFANNRLVAKPVIVAVKCTNCGTCVTMCPAEPKALTWRGTDKSVPPNFDYSRCIRCYCCQEVCPEGAVRLRKPFIKRLAGLFG